MKVTTEELPERQVKLQIEVDDERHNKAIEAAYKKLAPKVQIAGFRAGKAPRKLIEKELGRHRLLDEAMDMVVPEAYAEALEEAAISKTSPALRLLFSTILVWRTPADPLKLFNEHFSDWGDDFERNYKFS